MLESKNIISYDLDADIFIELSTSLSVHLIIFTEGNTVNYNCDGYVLSINFNEPPRVLILVYHYFL